MAATTNTHELRIVGMSRSGNHAIINWIIAQLNGRFCFLNCAEPKTNPFVSARPLANDQVYRTNIPGFDLELEQQGQFSQKEWLIHSYEDCFLGMINSPKFEKCHDVYVGTSKHRYDIVILRDPFNLFASRFKWGVFDEDHDRRLVSLKTAIRIWKQHARAFMEPGRYLPNKRISISYNRWFKDKAYRREIANALSLRFDDSHFKRVASTAGGSSFDGLSKQNSAVQMNVLERWRAYTDNPGYTRIFKDEKLVNLSKVIFSEIPGTEQLMRK